MLVFQPIDKRFNTDLSFFYKAYDPCLCSEKNYICSGIMHFNERNTVANIPIEVPMAPSNHQENNAQDFLMESM